MMTESNARKRHEFMGVLVLIAAVLLFFCLISYSHRDPSLNAISYKVTAENNIGRIGAYVSDLLFQIFGLSSFMFLFPLILIGWKLIRGHATSVLYLRALGFLLLIAVISATLQIMDLQLPNAGFHPGGVVGVLLCDMLLPNLNKTGTIIILIGAFILGILATTRFSLQTTFEKISPEAKDAKPSLWQRWREWRESRKPTRAVVNIKSPATPSIELTPRPAPILKPVPRPESTEKSTTPIIAQPAAETPRNPVHSDKPKSRKFILPPIDLLTPQGDHVGVDESELMETAHRLAERCAEFDVHGSVTQIHPGPVVTTFEFKPDAGVKYSRITSLVDDLCLGIKAESIRIDRLPGKATVGMEVPNSKRETIMLRELMESDAFRKSASKLTLSLGKLINGNAFVTDLAKMPHLLIAGATGAGKSVALNCMITSILYKAIPEEVRFIFIDPKRLELGIYKDIPHLLTPIVTDPKEASNALRWATNEMETRYKKLALRGVRNIDQYNSLIRSTGRQLSLLDADDFEGELEKPLPFLVIVIDELADLMMVSSHEVEESISRLAAMARAVGIHLILATQRPSVDVITGVIKANFPCRIAFKVASKVDSRTIIDSNGAEQLLGNGDMLFIPPGSSRLVRIHGAYVSEKETQSIVSHLRTQGNPFYDETVLTYGQEELDELGNPVDPEYQDSLYNEAVRVVVGEGRASTSLLQRRLSIGYGRAAKLIDMMHQNNLVGPPDGSKPREVLVGLDFLERIND
jgi:DNA segregation ATPase FtsK/SpoIIIE, S-DNA-T family